MRQTSPSHIHTYTYLSFLFSSRFLHVRVHTTHMRMSVLLLVVLSFSFFDSSRTERESILILSLVKYTERSGGGTHLSKPSSPEERSGALYDWQWSKPEPGWNSVYHDWQWSGIAQRNPEWNRPVRCGSLQTAICYLLFVCFFLQVDVLDLLTTIVTSYQEERAASCSNSRAANSRLFDEWRWRARDILFGVWSRWLGRRDPISIRWILTILLFIKLSFLI